jgi:transcriptional regulator with XRE-family HTH domain
MIPEYKTDALIFAQALGKRIWSLRKARGLSQLSLAVLCNLHVSHFRKIERGKANPGIQTFFTIARALGINLSGLFAGLPVTQPCAAPNHILTKEPTIPNEFQLEEAGHRSPTIEDADRAHPSASPDVEPRPRLMPKGGRHERTA